MLHLLLEHFLLHSKWLGLHHCSRSRLSIPLRWKTIGRSHFHPPILPYWELVQRVMASSAVCTSPPHHRGAPRLVMGPLLFAMYTTSLGPIIHSHGFSDHCYANDTQMYLFFPPDGTTVSARISDCLADISTWMKNHH